MGAEAVLEHAVNVQPAADALKVSLAATTASPSALVKLALVVWMRPPPLCDHGMSMGSLCRNSRALRRGPWSFSNIGSEIHGVIHAGGNLDAVLQHVVAEDEDRRAVVGINVGPVPRDQNVPRNTMIFDEPASGPRCPPSWRRWTNSGRCRWCNSRCKPSLDRPKVKAGRGHRDRGGMIAGAVGVVSSHTVVMGGTPAQPDHVPTQDITGVQVLVSTYESC